MKSADTFRKCFRVGKRKESVIKLNDGKPEQIDVVLSDRASALLSGIVLTGHDVLDIVSELVEKTGAKSKVARGLGMSDAYFGDVLMGKRPISARVAERIGLKRVVVFVREGVNGHETDIS